jgi:hypothetical protein
MFTSDAVPFAFANMKAYTVPLTSTSTGGHANTALPRSELESDADVPILFTVSGRPGFRTGTWVIAVEYQDGFDPLLVSVFGMVNFTNMYFCPLSEDHGRKLFLFGTTAMNAAWLVAFGPVPDHNVSIEDTGCIQSRPGGGS